MSVFSYRALDQNGQEVKGQLTSTSKNGAYAALRDRGLSPYALKQEITGQSLRINTKPSEKKKAQSIRQLGVLLSAGLPLSEAMATLANNNAEPVLSQRALKIRRKLRAGTRFSIALSEEYDDLPSYVTRLAELGEATGALGPAMMEAADKYEYDLEIQSEIRSALTYPIFLILAGSVIVLLLFLFVVPQFAELLQGSNQDIPAISRAVIDSSMWLRANLVLASVLAVGTVLLCGLLFTRLKSASAYALEAFPPTRSLLIAGDMAKWCSTLDSALRHGSGLLQALELAESEIRSPRTRAGLVAARKSVRGGDPLDVAIAKHIPRFDQMVLDMIKTGRISGKLPDMLKFASESFRRDAKERTKNVTALIEPLAILVISLIVGTVVISIVLAMTSLYEISP